jgi:hypothetical protein
MATFAAYARSIRHSADHSILLLIDLRVTDAEIVRERRVTIAQRRERLDDPAEQEFLNLRAGAESLVNEMYHKDGEKTKFTGKIKVKNASIAKAMGRNLKRASGFLESEAKQENSAG